MHILLRSRPTLRFVWSALAGLAILAGLGDISIAQERASRSASMPDYQLLRQNEDWSTFRERPAERPTLKAIPLAAGGPFLTVGGQVRSYARWYRNERWGRGPARDGYLLQRVMLHGSVETEGSLRGFLQLKSGVVAERDGPVSPPDRDRLGVNQAFLEWAATSEPGREWTVRVGRQELHYGAGRMIAVREGPNVRLGFDAVLGRYRDDPWRVEAFVAKPTETPPGVLNNGWMQGRTLWGAYLQRTGLGEGTLSAYYFGTKRNPSPIHRSRHATRHTLGLRLYGSMGPLGYDLEGAVQGGRHRPRSGSSLDDGSSLQESVPIRAWMLSGRLAYRAPGATGQPTLGVVADISSGDIGDTAASETFAAPYPSGRFTGAGSRLGPGNLIKVQPFVGLQLGALRVDLKSYVFGRLRATDAIYAIWGAPLRPAADTDARFVGVMSEVMLTANVGRHLTLVVEASHFNAGSMLRESGPSHGLTHVGLRASYVF